MPRATEVQNIPTRETGQRGIDSFFKSPKASPVVKDKKDLFSYFKKKVNSSLGQLNGTSNQKESNVVEQEKEEVEVSGKESDVDTVIDVESEASETEMDEQTSSQTDGSTTENSVEEESSASMSEEEPEVVEVVKEKVCKSSEKPAEGSSSRRQNIFAFMMANRSKQNEVLKEMREEEESAENNSSETLLNKKGVMSNSDEGECDGKKSKKVDESNNTVHVDENEIKKKIGKEKRTVRRNKKSVKKNVQLTETESSAESCEELEVVFEKKDDTIQNNSHIPAIAPKPKLNKVHTSYSGGNAFAFMMANRHKQDKALSENESGKGETSEGDNNENSDAPTDNAEKNKNKGRSRKKKQEDLDSSLADFEISEKEEPKKISKPKKTVRKRKTGTAVSGQSDPPVQASEIKTGGGGGLHKIPIQTTETKAKEEITKEITESVSKNLSEATKSEDSQRNTGNIVMSDDEEKCQTSIKDEREATETKPPTETTEYEDSNVKQKNVKTKTPKTKKVRVVAVKNKKQKISTRNIVDKSEHVTNKTEIPIEKNTEESQIKSEIVEKEKRSKNKKNVAAVEVSSMENDERVKVETAEAEEPPRKRRRKKVDYVVDSDQEEVIDHKTNQKINPEETGDKDYTIPDADTENSSKKGNISTFFKKISKEEKAAERSKNIFTVKADVHAPCDGMLESSKMEHAAKRKKIQGNETADKENVSNIPKDKKNDRRISRRIKKRQELEELNKIELLEQITPTNSPIKLPAHNLREINITSNDLSTKERVTDTNAEAAAVENKTFETKNNNVAKKVRNKARKRLLQEENDCVKIEENKNGDEAKIPLEDLPLNEENIEKKEPAKKSRRRLSRKAVSEPPDTVDQAVLPKENTLPESTVESIETPSSKLDATQDEIFPKSTRATRARSLNKSMQDTSTDTDTSIGSRKRSPRTRDNLLSESMESEDDKENVVHYTSTLIQKPGKLSLRLKKVQPTLKTRTKGRKSLSLKHNNVAESCPAKAKARELVQKAKLAKRSPKGKVKRLSMSRTKKKSLSNDVVKKIVEQNVVQVNMVQTDNDVVLIDDDEVSPVKSTKKKRQMLLKPPTASTPKTKLVKRKVIRSKKGNQDAPEEVKVPEDTVGESSRRSSRQAAANAKKMIEEQQEIEEEVKVEKTKKAEKEKPVKESKLAPIFCKKKVIELSPSKLKARQDFLQSGVPDQIKKQVLIEKSQEEEVSEWPPFPAVSHVQQRSDTDSVWSLVSPNIEKLKETNESDSSLVPLGTKIYNTDMMSKLEKESTKLGVGNNPTLDVASIIAILLSLKKENPHFPALSVFKSYLDLKKDAVDLYKKELEKEESKIKVIDLEEEEEEAKRGKRKRRSKGSGGSKRSRLSGAKGKKKEAEEKGDDKGTSLPLWQERIPHAWTQVFTPKHTNQVIGNTGHIRKMRMWLQEWKRKAEIYANKEKNGKKKKTFRKDDDFLISDDSSSFGDDDFVNTFLLSGPPGIGKTSAVYALATELGYKVLEVNASSRRQGKQVMTQLAEATQSHSVSSKTSQQPANTLTAMFAAKASADTKPSPKKVNLLEESQNSNKDLESKKKVALVLFEDIDIVFEEWDEGFIATVNNFMATSKRPIILTVSDSSPNVLAKIKGNYEKLDFVSPPEDLIAQHLQLVCLANGHHICLKDVQTLVHVNKRDVRQSLHDLQLWTMSGSSFQICDCLENSQKDDAESDREEVNSNSKVVKDLSLSDIFPDADQVKTSNVELYKSGFWGKIKGSAVFDSKVVLHCDRRKMTLEKQQESNGNICWSQISSNLPLLLPLPLTETEETKPKYPLQPDDPLLKTTPLWQRHSWLSIDEDEEELEQQPVTEEKKEEKEVEEEEKEVKQNAQKIPPNVQRSSRQCLESMAYLYDTIAQLDVLDSSQLETYPGRRIEECGWWTRQPTAGLSDEQDNCDLPWAPRNLTNDLTQFIGQKAVKYCHEELSAALPKDSVTEWPQLSLKIHNDMRVPSLIPHESKANSLRQEHRRIAASITKCLPAINYINKNTSTDHLPCIRSLIRYDELSAAISKNRRGRRFLSNVAHLGIDLSAEEKLKTANALLS